MNEKNSMRDFAEEWERAAERAMEETNTEPLLDDDELSDATGLHVQSGVKGGWTHTCSCTPTCTCSP